MEMQSHAVNAAMGGFDRISAFASELDATRKMMSQPEWALVTGQAANAYEQSFGRVFEEGSIYNDIFRKIEADLAAANGSSESESDYLGLIEAHLRKHNRSHSVSDLLAILGILFAIYAWIASERDNDEQHAETRALAERVVADAEVRLESRMERQFQDLRAEMETLREEPLTKWAARELPVVARIAPASDARKLAVLMPYQVVTQLDHKGKYIEVEFQDHATGIARVGWVQKKYFERLAAPLRRSSAATVPAAQP